MEFKAGDIVEGTEGDGKTWANTTTLLLLYVESMDSVCAVVLKSVNPMTGEDNGRRGDAGQWVLNARPWKKVGQVPALAHASGAVDNCVECFKAMN